MQNKYFENEIELDPVRLNAVFCEFYIHHAIGDEIDLQNDKMILCNNDGSIWVDKSVRIGQQEESTTQEDVSGTKGDEDIFGNNDSIEWSILKYKLGNDIIEIRRFRQDNNNINDDSKRKSIKFSFNQQISPYSFLYFDQSIGIIKPFLNKVAKLSSLDKKVWYQHKGWTVCITDNKIKNIETACVIGTMKYRLKISYAEEEEEENSNNGEINGDDDNDNVHQNDEQKWLMMLEWSPCVVVVNHQSLGKSIMAGQNPLNLCGKQILYTKCITNNSTVERVKKMATFECEVFTIQSVKLKEQKKKNNNIVSQKDKKKQGSSDSSDSDNKSVDSSDEESNLSNDYIIITTSGVQISLENCWEILPFSHSPAIQEASLQCLHTMRIELNSPQQSKDGVSMSKMLIVSIKLEQKFLFKVQSTINLSPQECYSLPSPMIVLGGGQILYPSSSPIVEYEKYETKLLKEMAQQFLQREWTSCSYPKNQKRLNDLSSIQDNNSSFSQRNCQQLEESYFISESDRNNQNNNSIQFKDYDEKQFEKEYYFTVKNMNIMQYNISQYLSKETIQIQIPDYLIDSILGHPQPQLSNNNSRNDSNNLNGWQLPRQSSTNNNNNNNNNNNSSKNYSQPRTIAGTSLNYSQLSKSTQQLNRFTLLDQQDCHDVSSIKIQHNTTTINNHSTNQHQRTHNLNDRIFMNTSNTTKSFNQHNNTIHRHNRNNNINTQKSLFKQLKLKQQSYFSQQLSHQYFGLSSPHTLASNFIMDSWAIVYQEQERELVFGFTQLLKIFSTTVGIQYFNPIEIILPKSCKSNANWIVGIKECLKMYKINDLKLIISVFPQGSDIFDYKILNYLLQRFCALEQQCILFHFQSQELFPLLNLPDKDNNNNIQDNYYSNWKSTAARRIFQNLLLIAAKCRASLWRTVQNHSQITSNLMIIGVTQTLTQLDYDSQIQDILSVVSSTDDSLSQFFSQSIFDGEEVDQSCNSSSYISRCPLEIGINTAIKEKQKRKNNNKSNQPLTIVIFRDYNVYQDEERNNGLKEQEIDILNNLYDNIKVKFLLINVETNVLECLFPQKSVVLIESVEQFNQELEENKILPDFYICSDGHSITRYECIVNHSEFSLSEIISLAHSQCYNCYLPSSPCAHPGIFEYSRRLSKYTAEILKCEVPERLNKTLFFI